MGRQSSLREKLMLSDSILIIGSAPNAIEAKPWSKHAFRHMIAINNAWQVRDDWDYLIFPDDFPVERRPALLSKQQQIVTSADYVPIQNDYGGFVYAGGTMAFTAAYWALGQLKPKLIAFIGCDMVYPAASKTHFYGTGTADPLRDDVSLQSLEAKSLRLQYYASIQDCLCVNLSVASTSRLTFPRVHYDALQQMTSAKYHALVALEKSKFDESKPSKVLSAEMALGYYFKTGKYWDHLSEICKQSVYEIDQLWLSTYEDAKAS